MKNYKLLWGASAVILCGAFALPFAMDHTQRYIPRSSSAAVEKQQGIKGAQEWLFNIRKNPVTGTVDYNDVLRAQEQARLYDELASSSRTSSAPNLLWQEVGPDNVGGRTRAIVVDKDDPNRMYAAGVSGGFWMSTDAGTSWYKYNDMIENLAVVSICQAANGDVYFGTGEGNGLYYLLGSGSAGILGGGIWKSTDHGQSFTRLTATIPSAQNSSSADFAAVNKMAAHPTDANTIYAATDRGIRISTDGGQTWSNPVTTSLTSTTLVQNAATDVEVAPDGSYALASISGKLYKSPTGAFQTWDNISDGGTNELPSGGMGRIEFNIAPSDANYIYASVAKVTGRLYNIYLSTDAGNTWSVIGPGGSLSFEPFGAQSQGNYDNAIAVLPNNKYSALVAGVELWKWVATASSPTTGQWTRIALENPDVPQNPYYVHADKHVITFKPGTPSTFYIGCDGGIFRTTDGGQTYSAVNKYYNVTQFYSVAFKAFNMDAGGTVGNIVMGGAQDNGTQFIDGSSGNSVMSATQVGGGDGAWCEFSMLNPSAMFTTVYYGSLGRSSNDGSSMSGFYNSRINALDPGNNAAAASFVTPIALWESRYEPTSPDSITVIATTNMPAGTTDTVPSLTNGLPVIYTTPVAISAGDTFKVQDYYQSKLAVGFTSQIFMTRGALDFSSTPKWTKIAGARSKPNAFSGVTQTLAWDPNGDVLYVGTDGGKVYRISNIKTVIDSTKNGDIDSVGTANTDNQLVCTQIGGFSGRCVTGLAVDPNGSKLIVTLGNYGTTNYIYICQNRNTAASSTTTTNFTAITGTGLPTMPVYGATFDKWNPNSVVLGTEMGVYATDDVTASTVTWVHETDFPNVPVFQIRQAQWPTWESNISGYIYAATHGRGIWRTTNTAAPVGINEPSHTVTNTALSVIVSPNPVSEKALVGFTLRESGNVILKVYDLRGQLVRTIKRDARAGVVQVEIDSQELTAGTYLVSIEAGAQKGTAKFVVVK